jgi:hypothetical protein
MNRLANIHPGEIFLRSFYILMGKLLQTVKRKIK